MSHHHILSIEAEAHLSIESGRLRVRLKNREDPVYFAPSDIAVVILDHPAITLSHSVIRSLSAQGALLVSSDHQHMPDTLTLPYGTNRQGTVRAFAQARCFYDQKSQSVWADIIAAKIRGQAQVLTTLEHVA